MIVSVAGAALLAMGTTETTNQSGIFNTAEVSAKSAKTRVVGANSAVYRISGKKAVKMANCYQSGQKSSS